MSLNNHDLKPPEIDGSDQKFAWTPADNGSYYKNAKRNTLPPLLGSAKGRPEGPVHKDGSQTDTRENDARENDDGAFETSFGLRISQFPNIQIMVDGNGPVTVAPDTSNDDAALNGAKTLVIHLSEEEFARHHIELRNLVTWINKNRKRERCLADRRD